MADWSAAKKVYKTYIKFQGKLETLKSLKNAVCIAFYAISGMIDIKIIYV